MLGPVNSSPSATGRDTRSVVSMQGMFYGAYKFNQPIGTFNTAAVVDMSDMFYKVNTKFSNQINS